MSSLIRLVSEPVLQRAPVAPPLFIAGRCCSHVALAAWPRLAARGSRARGAARRRCWRAPALRRGKAHGSSRPRLARSYASLINRSSCRPLAAVLGRHRPPFCRRRAPSWRQRPAFSLLNRNGKVPLRPHWLRSVTSGSKPVGALLVDGSVAADVPRRLLRRRPARRSLRAGARATRRRSLDRASSPGLRVGLRVAAAVNMLMPPFAARRLVTATSGWCPRRPRLRRPSPCPSRSCASEVAVVARSGWAITAASTRRWQLATPPSRSARYPTARQRLRFSSCRRRIELPV